MTPTSEISMHRPVRHTAALAFLGLLWSAAAHAQATEAQPENVSYLDTIGWVYFRLGKYEEAEKFIKSAIDKGGASAVLYDHLGDIYFMMKDRERAIEQWNIALKLDENNATLREKVQRGTL